MSMGVIMRGKRKELGLTQEQVANLLGVSPPAVNKWEKGATCPDMGLLPAVARGDVAGGLKEMDALLGAATTLGEVTGSPLCCHRPVQKMPADLGERLLESLLCNLEQEEEYAFLRQEPEYKALVDRHRARLST